MRIVHLSDVHVEVPASMVKLRDLFGRRWAGYVNLHFGPRRKHFTGAGERLRRVVDQILALKPDYGIVSGDLTALGLDEELAAARECLAPLLEDPARWLVIPGNHDVYTVPDARRDLYEKHFGDLRRADLEIAGRNTPYARFFGERLALVICETCEANRVFWDSRGNVQGSELDALREILTDPRLEGREVWLISHYAPYGPSGAPDKGWHGVKNLDDLLDVLRTRRPELWLHGHIHRNYALVEGETEFRVSNAGSGTHLHRPTFQIYEATPDGWEIQGYDASEEVARLMWKKALPPGRG